MIADNAMASWDTTFPFASDYTTLIFIYIFFFVLHFLCFFAAQHRSVSNNPITD